jgi:hypothetical protein
MRGRIHRHSAEEEETAAEGEGSKERLDQAARRTFHENLISILILLLT